MAANSLSGSASIQVDCCAYCHIGIHEPHPQIDKNGRWHGLRAFDVEMASKQLIESRIASKSSRLATYREAAKGC